MKRAMWVALAAVALAVSCGKLDCEPRTVAVSGDLSQDLLGSWDGFGVDSRVVFTFLADGGLTIVEEPNMYAPSGNRSRSGYQLADGGVRLDQGAFGAQVTPSELALADDSGYVRRHQALTCRGADFR